MDVKEAVRTAKKYVIDLFSEEDIRDVVLEEIVSEGGAWKVTLSFIRPQGQGLAVVLSGTSWKDRSFKVIEVDDFGEVRAVRHRTFPGLD